MLNSYFGWAVAGIGFMMLLGDAKKMIEGIVKAL